jgi:hypothetical protein
MRHLLVLCLLLPLAGSAVAGDEATISKHRGKKGGVVVLWPRIVPEGGLTPDVKEVAVRLHQRLAALAGAAADEKKVVVRPYPERVCPQTGCKSVSVGVVLGHQEGGCFAVGLVGAPDAGSVQLIPWAGRVSSSRRDVAFRDPPENLLVVNEFVPCGELLSSLNDGPLVAAIETAVERSLER